MAVDSTDLMISLVEGGLTPAAARAISNALANAATPQYSQSRDVADATPREQLRLIDSDTRRYLLTNLDFSNESPYQASLQANPGQYAGGPADHPYKDAQPVAPVPPLSQNSVTGGDFISVDNTVRDNAPVASVSLKLGVKSGPHLRINSATKSVEAVPITFNSPQGLVTGSITNEATATNVEIVVRALSTIGVTLGDGSTANILGWTDSSVSKPYNWLVPPGAVMPFANTLSSPSGWLLCDGSTYSRTTYANLFGAIGTTYGVGDGSTTFAVPDLRGYFVRGSGTNADGTASGTLGVKTADSTKLPTASFTGTTSDPGNHTHNSQAADTATGTGPYHGELTSATPTLNIATTAAGAHTHTVTINGGGDSETRPKNIALPYYIKT